MEEKRLTFEELMAKLDSIVKQLDAADCPLDEMVSLYTEGKETAARCASLLDEYEAKLVVLPESDGER